MHLFVCVGEIRLSVQAEDNEVDERTTLLANSPSGSYPLRVEPKAKHRFRGKLSSVRNVTVFCNDWILIINVDLKGLNRRDWTLVIVSVLQINSHEHGREATFINSTDISWIMYDADMCIYYM